MLDQEAEKRTRYIKHLVDRSVIMRVSGWPMSNRRWTIVVGDEEEKVVKEFTNEDDARDYARSVKFVLTKILSEVEDSID